MGISLFFSKLFSSKTNQLKINFLSLTNYKNFFLIIFTLCIFISIIYHYNYILLYQISLNNQKDLTSQYSNLENLDLNNNYNNYYQQNINNSELGTIFYNNENNFNLFWPTPGYTRITSPFGHRISPITGQASTHSGIDIGAAEGSNIYSVSSGMVIFAGFNGANGYSIHIQNNNFTFIYGHVSPNYIITKGDIINKGQIIGNVGPKYVEFSSNNPYKDSSGKSTNGSTTGPHLHLTIKKDGRAVNPLDYYN